MNQLEKISTVIEYIESHLTEKLDLTSVAQGVGYSKYHLHRIFTNIVGLSIHNYILRRKLTEAAKLLAFSEKSILDISLISGYESQQAFTTVFKQMYKKSPKEYREAKTFYPLQLKFSFSANDLLSIQNITKYITFASAKDIPLWMDLVHLVIDGFPYLNEEEYLNVLKKSILEKRAFILKKNHTAIAIMIINYETGNIDFFGIHPLYKKTDIAKEFITKIQNDFFKNREISITTFRKNDKADTGYRKLYKELGFIESELLIEFGYPTQRFLLLPSKGETANV